MREHSNHFHRGSALLIVLGMLSFMVISAVGFSVYMRQSRVPSSHLRREATARYLLKSALANAVARLDGVFDTDVGRIEGIYDDAYPGLNGETMVRYNGDHWSNRIFTPFGQVAPDTTVSTLTLEGLGYLPPALINEARVFSRTTRTARWKNLAYDLGRYAFCAIDVSDCFDVNKLANVKRRSSHAGERISLSSLYPDNPGELESKIKKAPDFSTTPFVSLADFNVALGTTDYTPFVRYVNDGGNNGNVYLNDDKAVSNALFVTDTWFPATNAYLTADLELRSAGTDATHYFDLSSKTGQPWKESDFGVESFPYIPCSAGFGKVLQKNLGGVGLACLYDYLDEDQVPISLALPTVEAVPMVCGVNLAAPQMTVDFSLDPDTSLSGNLTFTDANGNPRSIKRDVQKMTFAGLDVANAFVSGTVMFPFKRMKTDKRTSGAFQVEALVAVFFGTADMRARLSNDTFRPTKNDWSSGGMRDGIVFYKTASDSVSFSDDITKTENAFKQFKCQLKKQTVSMPVCYVVTEADQSVQPTPPQTLAPFALENGTVTADGIDRNDPNRFRLFDKNGNESTELTALLSPGRPLVTLANRQADGPNGGAATKQASAASALNSTYTPYVAVWVRVVKSGDAVDLVPAVCDDDEIHISGARYGNPTLLERVCHPLSGDGVPLLDFKDNRTAMEFKFDASLPTTIGAQPFEAQGWKSLYAVDPRYNFAPEDWISSTDADANPNKWRTLMKANAGDTGYFGTADRDRDIFMFTSDQEWLQSVGELQFLPFVQELGRTGISMSESDFKGISRYHGRNDFDQRTDPTSANLANVKYFWKTYSSYRGNAGMDPYYDLIAEDGKPVTVVNGAGDFRVNPLSPDNRALSAAIFDTPWDYYVASTNRQTNKAFSSVEGAPENFAFGTSAGIAADQWDETAINGLAGLIRTYVRDDAIDWLRSATRRKNPFDWGAAYEDLWYDRADTGNTTHDNQERLFNISLGSNRTLHGVDRKFLFSFWRECFQNRQQLFLLFLRAEPLTVGGAGGDSLANSQLGARGVALVWRDPAVPKSKNGGERKARGEITNVEDWRTQMENCPPHRTRVLFYHQFD